MGARFNYSESQFCFTDRSIKYFRFIFIFIHHIVVAANKHCKRSGTRLITVTQDSNVLHAPRREGDRHDTVVIGQNNASPPCGFQPLSTQYSFLPVN